MNLAAIGRRRAAAPADGMPAPAVLQVQPHRVRVGDGYAATYAVCGLPVEVGPAWLGPLLAYPGRISVAVHVEPIPAAVAAPLLRRQRSRLESSRRIDADRGRLVDPAVQAAAGDAADLADRVARGAAKLHHAGIYVTVHGRTVDELEQTAAGVRSAAAAMLLDLQPVTFRHHAGYTTTLPLGADGIGMRRIFDTASLAAAFPFAAADLPAPAPGQIEGTAGVLYGVNPASRGVVMWNRWAQDNHNSVVLARSGAGKSYLVKLDVLRSLYQGVQVAVVDPEDEYAGLAEHVGGTVVRLGAPGAHLNPFDIAPGAGAAGLRDRQLAVHTLITAMLGDAIPAADRQALDRAITASYTAAGISHDPPTWARPAPRIADLATHLAADPDPGARQLAARLAPWVTGAFKDLFAGPTTAVPEGHLVVWSLRHLPDELRTVATMLALDRIWSRIDRPHPQTRQLVVVDEAWLLMRHDAGARFLLRMAKAARKRRAGLTVVTQDTADLLASDLGMAVVSNAATQVLMRQAPQAIDAVTAAFRLTAGEARLLLSAGRGEALLVCGRDRVAFTTCASPEEHHLAVTGIGDDQ